MSNYQKYKDQFESFLKEAYASGQPKSLYEPVKYILHLGGKRFRPVLLLMTCDALGEVSNNALRTALGIEIFHNFTLMHDDIMDNAKLRRGAKTVHEKFNTNAAIISGDVMLIQATQYLSEVAADMEHHDLLSLFLQTAKEICEGQQYDMDFEEMEEVKLDQYLEMIRLKTAVLLGFSMYAGARLAQLSREQSQLLYQYGVDAGIAFQIWDDYLDVFGSDQTGKQKAGDIYNKKETYLIIQLKALMDENDRKDFDQYWNGDITSTDCNEIISLMKKYDIDGRTQRFSQGKMNEAVEQLNGKMTKPERVASIVDFTQQFISRQQ
jgi:geranylgeranyl diphosphate synthase type II